MLVLSILFKIVIGAFLGGIIGSLVLGAWPYTLVWALAIPAFILLALMGGLRAGAARVTASLALARIETIQRTGLEANGVQECELRLTVVPEKGEPYSTAIRMPVPTADQRTYVPGSILVVNRVRADRPEVTPIPTPAGEWADRVEKARSDPSSLPASSAVPAWETATTTTPGTRQPGNRSARVGLISSLALILASAAVTLIPAYGAIGRTATNIATGDWDGNNMVTGNYQQVAIDAIVDAAGSPWCTDVNFYDSYVIATCLTAPGADTTDQYDWRDGFATREGPSSIQSEQLSADLFDVTRLDWSRVPAAVELAIGSAPLEGAVADYAFVSVREYEGHSAQPTIYVPLSDDYRDAALAYSFDLEELDRSGTAFDR